jgi:hypothetical protein
MRSRELDAIALKQLEAWRAYASRWYWHMARRDTQTGHKLGAGKEQYHAICAVCDTSMAVLTSEGTGYLMNTEQVLDAVTRHLRNMHRGIEGEVYGNDNGQNTQVDTGARDDSDSDSAGTHPSGLQTKE